MRLQCKRNGMKVIEVWIGIINFCGHEVYQRAFNNKYRVYLRKNWACKCARKISEISYLHTYVLCTCACVCSWVMLCAVKLKHMLNIPMKPKIDTYETVMKASIQNMQIHTHTCARIQRIELTCLQDNTNTKMRCKSNIHTHIQVLTRTYEHKNKRKHILKVAQ